jgi:hypothetical protein
VTLPQGVNCRICYLNQERLGLVVTLMCTIFRVAISMTTKTQTTVNKAVYYVKKSQE